MTAKIITFLTAIGELHPNQQFLMSLPHNDELTEAEFNSCYLEGDGVTDDGIIKTTSDTSKFKVNYADVLAKYKELIAE